MKLKELLPLIDYSTIQIYEKRQYMPSRFIVLMNPQTNKGYISNELLDREICSLSITDGYDFRIFVDDKKKDDDVKLCL